MTKPTSIEGLEDILAEWYPPPYTSKGWNDHYCCSCIKCHEYRIQRAITAIKALLKSKLPEKREPSFEAGFCVEVPTHKVASCVNTGFNTCLSDIDKIVEEL